MGQLYHRTTLLLIYLWTFLIVTDLSILSFFLILDIQHLAPLAWFPSHGPQKTLLRASKGLKRGVWAVTWLINHPLHRVYVVYSQLRVCWLKPWHFIPQKQGLMESYLQTPNWSWTSLSKPWLVELWQILQYRRVQSKVCTSGYEDGGWDSL